MIGTVTSSSRENVLISKGTLPGEVKSEFDANDGSGNYKSSGRRVHLLAVSTGSTDGGCDAADSGID